MENHKQLVRGLGLLGLTASVFNCTVGGGIFKLPGSIYQIVGTAAPLVYLICFVVMLLVATVFIQVGKKITVSGGPYAYVLPVLGSYMGFICGVLLWSLATFAMASVANAYGSFATQLFPDFESVWTRSTCLALTLAGLAYFNIYGVKTGSKISMVLSAAKLLPLLLLIGAGMPQLNAEALMLPEVLDFDKIARGAMILIFAFTGVESALIPSGEIQNPQRNLPRAMYSALLLVLFLYVLIQFVCQGTLGSGLGQPGILPLAQAAESLMGPVGRYLLMIGAMLSTLGYLSAITLSLPRSLYAFAEDGYLPRSLARLHTTHATPARAIILQVIIAWLLAVSSQFEKLAVLANLSAILMYIICAVAALRLPRLNHSRFENLVSVGVPIAALIAMSFLLTSVTRDEWLSTGVLLVSATLIYRFRKQGSALSA